MKPVWVLPAALLAWSLVASSHAPQGIDVSGTAVDRACDTEAAYLSDLACRLRRLVAGLTDTKDSVRETARASGQAMLLYAPKPITDRLMTQRDLTPNTPPAAELRLVACRGEYESALVVVYALTDLASLVVERGPLTGPGGGVVPAEAVDVRVVKWWFQAGRRLIDLDDRRLVPELLLKDDALVRVDLRSKSNYLRSTGEDGGETYLAASGPTSENLRDARPVDAARLQPVAVAADSLKHFWVTVRVPDATPPGRYRGELTFRTGAGGQRLPLVVTVLPFALKPPRLIYSIYYSGRFAPDRRPTITSMVKSETQYRAELLDMKAHGVLYPNNWQKWDDDRIVRMLEIRRDVGLPAGRFYTLGLDIEGAVRDETRIPAVVARMKRLLEIAKPFGYDQVYFYGLDEARGERLVSQKKIWSAIQQDGGKTFVACYHGTFEAMGGLLDCAVLAFKPDPEEARKWHSVGSEIFCYANPQGGREEPETYRRNFGLVLWKAGYDGAMNFAYQKGFNHIWNDFDSPRYRDHVFAYPTANGVVDTLQWEGFREGIDDVRYVTTLEQAIAAAEGSKRTTAREARAWLDGVDPEKDDLDALRTRMIGWIIRLLGP